MPLPCEDALSGIRTWGLYALAFTVILVLVAMIISWLLFTTVPKTGAPGNQYGYSLGTAVTNTLATLIGLVCFVMLYRHNRNLITCLTSTTVVIAGGGPGVGAPPS